MRASIYSYKHVMTLGKIVVQLKVFMRYALITCLTNTRWYGKGVVTKLFNVAYIAHTHGFDIKKYFDF